MNIMTIVVLAVFALFVLDGLRKGLMRKINGVLSLIISAMLVSFLLPYVTDYIKEKTPVYEVIVQFCDETISERIADLVVEETAGTEDGLDRDQIRSLMSQFGMDTSLVDTLTDNELTKLVEQYFRDYLPSASTTVTTTLDQLTQVEQTRLIQSLPVPAFLQNLMITYNNSEGYKRLEVSDFGSYIIHFIANVILNIISFVATLLITWVVVWIILRIVDIVTLLPILHSLNRLGGLAIGALQGLMAVWFLFLLISMFSGTRLGMQLLVWIDESTILKPLYESNLFMKIVSSALGKMM